MFLLISALDDIKTWSLAMIQKNIYNTLKDQLE